MDINPNYIIISLVIVIIIMSYFLYKLNNSCGYISPRQSVIRTPPSAQDNSDSWIGNSSMFL